MASTSGVPPSVGKQPQPSGQVKQPQASTSTAGTLDRKIKKVLGLRTDTVEVRTALSHLGKFYTDNTIASRRALRGNIEAQALLVNDRFLSCFQAVEEELSQVQDDVHQLGVCCDEITDRLSAARDATKHLSYQSDRLKRERDKLQKCQLVADAFVSHFRLSPQEMHILRTAPVDRQFLDTLKRVAEIQMSCKDLLRTQHQRAGLEIMDEMATLQEQGYERLYRTVQGQLRDLVDEQPDLTPLLRESVKTLKSRPVLYKCCVEEAGSARRMSVARRFIAALTTGGPQGTPKPIEMHAHDPLRYVGDMLGWLHQSVASERDFVVSLFNLSPSHKGGTAGVTTGNAGVDITAASGDDGHTGPLDDNEVPLKLESLLDHIFEGVCRPFKVRVDQVIATERRLVTTYKLTNLLEFYCVTTSGILGDNAGLSTTLGECHEVTMQAFMRLLSRNTDRLSRAQPDCPADLSPPPAVYDTVNTLSEIMTVYESSLVAKESATREEDFEPVLVAVCSAVTKMCAVVASDLGPSDMAVFLLNCMSVLQNAVSGHDFASRENEALTAEIDMHLATLVDEQSSVILVNCGLAGPLQVLQGPCDKNTVANDPTISPTAIKEAAQSFYTQAFGTGEFVVPQCDRVMNPKLRAEGHGRIAKRLVAAYTILYTAVSNPDLGYPAVDTIFEHTPEQVERLVVL